MPIWGVIEKLWCVNQFIWAMKKYNPEKYQLIQSESVPNIFHFIRNVLSNTPVKFQDKWMIFCGGILSYNFIAALSKLHKKCHYRSKLRTVLKRIFARKWYRSSAFTNSRQSGENLINFVNQWSLSPRKAVSATVDCPEHVYNDFWHRSGPAWDTLSMSLPSDAVVTNGPLWHYQVMR